MYICKFLILCGFLDWSFNPSIPYASYRLFHLYHVSLDTPNAIQTPDIVLRERSGLIIILHLFFIISAWSVNYVSSVYGGSTTIYGVLLIAYIPPFPSLASPLLSPLPPGSITIMAATCIASCTTTLSLPYHRYGCYLYCRLLTGLVIDDDLGVVFIQGRLSLFDAETWAHKFY